MPKTRRVRRRVLTMPRELLRATIKRTLEAQRRRVLRVRGQARKGTQIAQTTRKMKAMLEIRYVSTILSYLSNHLDTIYVARFATIFMF